MRIIPALDIRDGKCVRLLYGDYDQQTDYDVDPVAQAQRYAALDLDELHIVDLDGAKAGRPINANLIQRMIEASGAQVQAGGGIRTEADAAQLFDNGVARIVIGSMAVKQPERIEQWFATFGGERLVLALDIRAGDDGVNRVCTDAWMTTTTTTLEQMIQHYLPFGLQHVLCTDIQRDGAMAGPATDLYADSLSRFPALCLQASGGVSNISNLEQLRAAGVPAAITGKALLEGAITDEEIRSF